MAAIEMKRAVRQILEDIRVEMADEFDRNFERQGFFSAAWQRRRSPLRPSGSVLIDSGLLRGSIYSKVEGSSVVFGSTQPYAAIHNTGGEIKVTARMKAYFWRRYYETLGAGAFRRRKDDTPRRGRRTMQLGTEAEFWKHMALMKVGRTVRIPKRQFIGMTPEVERAVLDTIARGLNEFFGQYAIVKN